MDKTDNKPDTAPRTVQINVDELQPNPAVSARAHRSTSLALAAIGSIGLGALGYLGTRSYNEHPPGANVNPLWATAVGAVVGGILGKWLGKKVPTEDEKVSALVSNAIMNSNNTREVKQKLADEIRRQQEESAMLAYMYSMPR